MSIIVNADDFGLNEHSSLAIAKAFKQSIITDTTIIANGEYFDEAVELSRKNHFDDRLGIHFNITEGIPLTDSIKKLSSFTDGGRFHGKINRIKPLSKADKDAVYAEISAQIKRIEDTGIKITHADSHHHIHTALFIAPIVKKVCKEHGINKIRLHRNIGNIVLFKRIIKWAYNCMLHKNGFITTRFFGSLEDVKNRIPTDRLEIMVHPDFDKNGMLIDRIDEKDGFSIGKELRKMSENLILTNYGELQ